MRPLLALLVGLVACAFQAAPAPRTPAGSGPFRDWAAVVVAGDWRASGGGETKAFENARRDVARALIRAGFAPANVKSFGIDPKEPGVDETDGRALASGLRELTGRARGGCLVYLTSHGSPQGAVFGRNGLLAPAVLDRLLDATCDGRPTVVFVSACYSGVFVPALAQPNRMVITAARRDRSSFGCGVDDVYPFFDACVLQAWPGSRDFMGLARTVQTCVSDREHLLKLVPPSEPQVFAGAQIRPLLPLLPLQPAPAPRPPSI